MKDKHVIVIGAGIIGLCCAYYLNKKGFKVTILDNTDGTDNCSYGNAGFFSPSHLVPLASPGIISQGLRWMTRADSPFYIKPKFDLDLISWVWKFWMAANKRQVASAAPILNELLMEGRSLIADILSECKIDAGLNESGLTIYYKSQNALQEEIELAHLASKYGQETEVLNAAQAQAKNPALELNIAGAVLFKNDAFVTPHLLMDGLKKDLISKGVNLQFEKSVQNIEIDNHAKIKAVIANGQSYNADEYVMATGAWTSKMLKQIDIKLPMQAGKGYSFVLASPKVMPKTSCILAEARVAVTPMTHGLRIAGTMELAGLDLSVNAKRVQGIVDSVIDYFPQFTLDDFKNIKPWSGLRPCTPDGMPYIGRTKKYTNLIVATGHAMLGVSLGPVTGKIVAQLVANETPTTDFTLLEVERYN